MSTMTEALPPPLPEPAHWEKESWAPNAPIIKQSFSADQIRERDAYWMAKLEEARKEGYDRGYKDGWDAYADGEDEG